ncbi:DUF3168 domain-containing protein [Salipiger sp. 1_MG-2023]|uniref:DUF3168 domain-containing protein n=1 Tax=Salipiger sp. 1_MG-2023 TaxID=3062665 RepID=UPI0026E23631|nr:DUF3168 domain-containing protein [Salipiger sp. 1_MG-2023]MDO6587331.1 DUF3168 domain-containing protein [Salipiger sp. 1_MG-2023]
MAAPEIELLYGIVAALRADAGVGDVVGDRIYDEVPQGATFPYIKFGNFAPSPVRTDCTTSTLVTFSLEAHSRPTAAGRTQALMAAAAMAAALSDNEDAVTVAGSTLVRLQWMPGAATGGVDADGESYMEIRGFEALLD